MKRHIRPEVVSMKGYVPGEQPQEGEAVKLNTNENPYRASESVYETICAVCTKGLSRYPDPVAGAFREEAARQFGVSPNWILCGNGSDDILTILTRTFVGHGELLRLPSPSYILYRSLAEIQGARSEEVRFNDDWTLPHRFRVEFHNDPDDSAALRAGNRLRLVFLPNPNSPSGTVISREEILEIAESLPCPLVVDEAYATFSEFNCLDLVKKSPKIMVCRTLSKSHSLAGLRFGYVVAQPELIEQMLKVKDSYNCDSLSIAAATAAIADVEWLARNRTAILATRERLTRRMRALGFSVPESHANFTWNTHPEVPLRPIYEYLKNNGILVRYMDYPGWGDGLRISVGTDEQTDRCVDRIEEFIANPVGF
ncbi:MAG TPA: histidinol-phosphate transaminase [Planctomycetaceae bacterium]|nr:histidinol-phosphate transaminase [Planctomycetaceae bacterium]